MLDDAIGVGDKAGIGEGIEQAVAFAAGGGKHLQVLGVLASLRMALAADEHALAQPPCEQAQDG